MTTYYGYKDAQGVWRATVDGKTLPLMDIFVNKLEDLAVTIMADYFKDREATSAYFAVFKEKYWGAIRFRPHSIEEGRLVKQVVWESVADELGSQAPSTIRYYEAFRDVLAQKERDRWACTRAEITAWVDSQQLVKRRG